MGYVRFLLALSIIFGHILISNKLLFGAPMALHLFFMISGYSIAYVLEGKYKSGEKVKLKEYYVSRLLRIYPVYILVLIGSAAFTFRTWMGLIVRYAQSALFVLWVIFSNILIIGQDLFMFTGYNLSSHALFFTNNFSVSPDRIDQLLLVPQSWALALILYFYIIAPWVVKRSTRMLLGFALCSLLLRVAFTSVGFPFEPWGYRFFPTELLFFLLGVLSYRWREALNNIVRHVPKTPLFLSVLTIIVMFRSLPYISFYDYQLFEWIFIAVFVLVLPFLFAYRYKDRISSILGELSYPMYLTHLLFSAIMTKLHLPDPYHGITTIGVTILGSYALVKMFRK